MSSRRGARIHALRVALAIVSVIFVACGSATRAAPSATPPATAVAPDVGSAPSPARGPLQVASVDFVSEQVGWLATFRGPLYRTTASGWTALPAVPDRVILDIDFVGTQVGWAIARYAPAEGCSAAPIDPSRCRTAVLRTQDGGVTWDERLVVPFTPSGTGAEPALRVAAVDIDTAWARLGDAGGSELRLTQDGGRSWRTVLRARGLGALAADSARGAWVIAPSASGADVLRTMDAGATWEPQLRGNAHALTRVGSHLWVLERDGAYCTASNCHGYRLRHSADAGASWTDLGNPKLSATCSGGHLGAPSFSDRDLLTGYIPISLGAGGARVGDGGVLVTADGGRTWTCESTPPNVVRVAAIMSTAFAVSEDRASGAHSVWRRSPAGAWTREPIP